MRRSSLRETLLPSQEHLLLEVVLERSIEEIDRKVAAAAGSPDGAGRVEGLVSAIHEEVAANEAGFRTLLQLSIAQSRPSSAQPTVASIRGQLRLQWIGQALEPIAEQIDAESLRRLIGAPALCVGAEAFVVLRDLCGMQPDDAADTLRWAARALVAAAGSAP
jgi:hypothetical protein